MVVMCLWSCSSSKPPKYDPPIYKPPIDTVKWVTVFSECLSYTEMPDTSREHWLSLDYNWYSGGDGNGLFIIVKGDTFYKAYVDSFWTKKQKVL